MSIEFRCAQCNKLLRTDNDTAGRQAQCPGCGAICTVPGAVDAAAMNATPPEAGALPVVGPAASYPQNADNPYRSPSVPLEQAQQQGPMLQAAAMQRVAAPAVALIVVSILGFAMYLVVAGIYGVMTIMLVNGNRAFLPPGQGQDPQALLLGCIFWIVVAIVGAITDVVILVGAMKMKKLENYGLAVTVAILSLIPCISPGCLFGLPFGIWTLTVLCDSSVRAAFRR